MTANHAKCAKGKTVKKGILAEWGCSRSAAFAWLAHFAVPKSIA
jgi:hypothetical protein